MTELSFQSRVFDWLHLCFGTKIAIDGVERNHRFLEESLELVQTNGCTASEAHQLVDYVFGRPSGDPTQEAGGVMVTLAAMLSTMHISMDAAAEQELDRINRPEIVDKIRLKQAGKPKHGPLPETAAYAPVSIQVLWEGTDDEIKVMGGIVALFGHSTLSNSAIARIGNWVGERFGMRSAA